MMQMQLRRRVSCLAVVVIITAIVAWLINDDMTIKNLAKIAELYKSETLDAIVLDLIDPTVVTRTPGASLVDQTRVVYSDISLSLPTQPVKAGETFYLTFQCDPTIIGTHLCAPQYVVHFRGPIAFSLSPMSQLYSHDKSTGETVVECHIPQSGSYEVWASPDWPLINDCPALKAGNELGTVRGSGAGLIIVAEGKRPEVDGMRACTVDDYASALTGRWVGVDYIRDKYRKHPLIASQIERTARIHGHTTMPDYVYLPYQCKRLALDYERAVASTPNMTQVLYLGDSILRSTYCGHLYTSLHDGTIGEDCVFGVGDEWLKYQQSDKTFEIARGPAESSRRVRFSQRFINGHPEEAVERIGTANEHDLPVSHLVINLGMWFGLQEQKQYTHNVLSHMENLHGLFGDAPLYTWVNTYSASASVFCHGGQRRAILRRHGIWAAMALELWKERHPGARLNVIQAHQIIDSRPETTSEGRHWVLEGGVPDLEVRPLVGAADDAVMEGVYDYWRLVDEHDRQWS